PFAQRKKEWMRLVDGIGDGSVLSGRIGPRGIGVPHLEGASASLGGAGLLAEAVDMLAVVELAPERDSAGAVGAEGRGFLPEGGARSIANRDRARASAHLDGERGGRDRQFRGGPIG